MPYVESLRVFVRVVERGSITAGGRDLRLTPAVASNRIKELEQRLDVRLFNRTTRQLAPTAVGREFYAHARKVLETLDEAEAAVSGFSNQPKGVIHVTAPLGVGKRFIAPLVPRFVDDYPKVSIRFHLSDRRLDPVSEGVDVAFVVGRPPDSNLKLRKVMECPRVLCAAPFYLECYGTPQTPDDLKSHACLLLRYPRSPEYFWQLETPDGTKRLDVAGSYDSDDGDVLTQWALSGRGIINKPRFEVAEHLASGDLVEILPETPPLQSTFGCLYPHRRLQDSKVRLFIDFMVAQLRQSVPQA
ncbi:MAG: LysR family transcriptional regulator [Pseudomonadota bacterium]